MRLHWLAGSAMALLLLGCATPGVQTDFRNSVVTNRSEDQVWSDLVQYFTTRNIQIKTIERDSGVVYAEQARFDPNMASCDKDPLVYPQESLVALNVFVRKISEVQTQVTVTGDFRQIGYFQGQPIHLRCYSTGALEASILNSVSGGQAPAQIGAAPAPIAPPITVPLIPQASTATAPVSPQQQSSSASLVLAPVPTQTEKLPGHRVAGYGCPGFDGRVVYAESPNKLPRACERMEPL